MGINLTQVDNKDANSTEAKKRNFDKSGEEACGNEEGVKSIMKYIMSMDEGSFWLNSLLKKIFERL